LALFGEKGLQTAHGKLYFAANTEKIPRRPDGLVGMTNTIKI
jgi:hypothetical protein